MVISENDALTEEQVGGQSRGLRMVVYEEASSNATFCERNEIRCEIQHWNGDENQGNFDAMISIHWNARRDYSLPNLSLVKDAKAF
jgi:hypothetical protein